MNDFLFATVCVIGVVFIILPVIGFLLWVAKEYIKFMIEQSFNGKDNDEITK